MDQKTYKLYRRPNELPDSLSAFRQPWAAIDSATSIRIVALDSSATAKDSLAKMRHDLKAAIRTMALFLDNLDAGYRFDDQAADAKRQALQKAVRGLKEHIGDLLEVFSEE